ncbi:DUF2116 family Zn-ribbon domain-containing protein [Alteromonas sp. RKMC-009]|uniref:DUF2116 family Zn-ribbon domain-containing protein n=1 Tax=Alteromonas sp. RKMC-009 TaxID=2267264 RepID=UPI000E6A0921|nr:DUF2116 family Zn-ribbon domain-containing protein [Alteromonas sp. RKMC-009]AYA64275.1 DUF2116 family Zn-ribbon domain-containing protein [Alteromonas sp. RKMC-009]
MFADPLDAATHMEEHMKQRAIQNIRNKGRELRPKGCCYFCAEELPKGSLFCDSDCSHDFELMKRNTR